MAQGEEAFRLIRVPSSVPWSLVVEHEAQAKANHSQSLERLAERGGLSPCELVAVLENRPWHRMTAHESAAQLLKLIAQEGWA
jgi:hypothetical protein